MFVPRLKYIKSDIAGPIPYQGQEHLEYSSGFSVNPTNSELILGSFNGTSSPTLRLVGNGSSSPNTSSILFENSTSSKKYSFSYDGNNISIKYLGTGGGSFTIFENGQVSIGIGSDTTSKSAILNLSKSTDKLSHLNFAAGIAPITPIDGDVWYDGNRFNTFIGTSIKTFAFLSDIIGGGGTVSSVSVVTANGFAGSVATPTTTPAITLSTTITGLLKGNGTAISAAIAGTDYQSPISLTTTGNSGAATFISNTLNVPTYTLSGLGGQPLNANLTSISGLTYSSVSFVKMTAAGTFALDTNTYLTSNQTITLSGDVTGSGTTSINTSISNSTVTGKLLTGYVSGAGTITASDSILSAIQKLNGNISALVTGVSSVNGGAGAVTIAVTGTTNRISVSGGTGLTPTIDISLSYIGQSSITTLGTITTGTWNANKISEIYGGTNQSSYSTGDILYASAANTLSKLPIGTAGQVLTVVAGVPTWVTDVDSSGTVTSFSSGNLSPLFTTTVTNSTTTPSLSFTLSNANPNTWFGNNTGSSGVPSYNNAGSITKTDDTNVTLTLGGTPTNSLLNSVSFTLGWTGTLAATRGGTGTSTAFTQGSIVFAGASGVYSQDNANFFWDNTNKRLGIKTNTPLTTAHIAGDTTIESVTGVFTQVVSATTTTTNATVTTLQTIAIPTNTVVMIEARVQSRKTAGAGSGTIGDGNGYIRIVKAKNVAGVVTIGAVQTPFTSEDITPFDATLAVSGTNVILQVTGSNNNTVTWTSSCIITR